MRAGKRSSHARAVQRVRGSRRRIARRRRAFAAIRHEFAAAHRAGSRIAALPMDGMGTSHRRRPRARRRSGNHGRAHTRHGASEPEVARPIRNPSPAPAETVTASAANPQMRPNGTGQARFRDAACVRARSQRRFPEIIVPQGQLAAAAQLSAAISSGRVDGNQLLAVQRGV